MVISISPEISGQDVFGIGKIVDEASEVIHELDRPIGSVVYHTPGKKKGSFTHVELNVSKLDILMIFILAIAAYSATKMHYGLPRFGSTWLYNEMQALRVSDWGGRIKNFPETLFSMPNLNLGGGGLGALTGTLP